MIKFLYFLLFYLRQSLPGHFHDSRPNFSNLEARPPRLEAKPVFSLISDNFENVLYNILLKNWSNTWYFWEKLPFEKMCAHTFFCLVTFCCVSRPHFIWRKNIEKIVPNFLFIKVIFNAKLTLFVKNRHEARLEAKPISGGQTGGQRARPICRRPGCFPGGQIFGIWPPGGQTGNPELCYVQQL